MTGQSVSGRALLTADDVAGRLGVPKSWVYAQVRAGGVPHVRLGRYVRFRPEAIDEWLAAIEREARPSGRIAT